MIKYRYIEFYGCKINVAKIAVLVFVLDLKGTRNIRLNHISYPTIDGSKTWES